MATKTEKAGENKGPWWRPYVRALGPGLITGASDDDPSGIATYAQAGASLRLGLLWAALITLPLMGAVQEICDRTALATGRSLGELTHKRLGKAGGVVVVVLMIALLVADGMNIAADLGAIGSGMALLHAGPAWPWALVSGVGISVLVVAGSFELIGRVFKLLCLSLLTYVVVLFVAHIDWGAVALHTVVPHITLSSKYLTLLVAVLGTTISPYLFFWQSADRVEELRDEPEGGARPVKIGARTRAQEKRKVRTSRVDVFTGVAFSNVVMFAIITATAATLGSHPNASIQSAADAARALRPAAGAVSTVLFAVGFIGTGFLAVPVLAAAASAGLAGFFGKRWGFSRSWKDAPVFYLLVLAGTAGGTLLSVLGVNVIKLLVIVAEINGLAAAPFLIVVMMVSDDRRIMGAHRNGTLARVLGWTTVVLMALAAVALVATGGGS